MSEGSIDLFFDEDTHEVILRFTGASGATEDHRVEFPAWELWLRQAESVTRNKKNEWEIQAFAEGLRRKKQECEMGECAASELQDVMDEVLDILNKPNY